MRIGVGNTTQLSSSPQFCQGQLCNKYSFLSRRMYRQKSIVKNMSWPTIGLRTWRKFALLPSAALLFALVVSPSEASGVEDDGIFTSNADLQVETLSFDKCPLLN